MILRAVRPTHFDASTEIPPRVSSPWGMELALQLLRYADKLWLTHPSGRWRRMPWMPWHAIAVALAVLCSAQSTATADETWITVDKAIQRYTADVADSENGMLWEPIKRLYEKAAALRDIRAPKMHYTVPGPGEESSDFRIPTLSIPDGVSRPAPDQPQQYPPLTETARPIDLMEWAPFDSTVDNALEVHTDFTVDDSWLDWQATLKGVDEVMNENGINNQLETA